MSKQQTNFSENLKALMDEKRVTPCKLATILTKRGYKTDSSTISKWRNEWYIPSEFRFKGLCEYFGITKEQMLSNEKIEVSKKCDNCEKLRIMYNEAKQEAQEWLDEAEKQQIAKNELEKKLKDVLCELNRAHDTIAILRKDLEEEKQLQIRLEKRYKILSEMEELTKAREQKEKELKALSESEGIK